MSKALNSNLLRSMSKPGTILEERASKLTWQVWKRTNFEAKPHTVGEGGRGRGTSSTSEGETQRHAA